MYIRCQLSDTALGDMARSEDTAQMYSSLILTANKYI